MGEAANERAAGRSAPIGRTGDKPEANRPRRRAPFHYNRHLDVAARRRQRRPVARCSPLAAP
ncbi:histidine kinase [Burkholderia pseudomallei]|nr:histidine kinase [Burkholderia pseudomallei]TXD02215.1 histidine kinase [Burkholderia pseudomallei]